MQSISVPLAERTYPIWIGTNCESRFAEIVLPMIRDASQWIFVSDERIVESIAAGLASKIQMAGGRTASLTVKSGEESKSVNEIGRLWNEFLELKADRKSVIFAVGGGVIGDLVGFAAATFNRGLRFVQVPTTLLAMVDSSVGGKTGINLPKAKNVVGAFWQPQLVWIDSHHLQSLPQREFVSGLAEVVKYGVILDAEFFAYLENHCDAILRRDPTSIEYLVRRSCELKAMVVSQDERETTGLRAILNYGHTFGHAIEAITAYGTLLHGEAVAIGMTMAARLAVLAGHWTEHEALRQHTLLKKLTLPTTLADCHLDSISSEAMIASMRLDKKTSHGKLHFILPTTIGHVETFSDCDDAIVSQAIRY